MGENTMKTTRPISSNVEVDNFIMLQITQTVQRLAMFTTVLLFVHANAEGGQ